MPTDRSTSPAKFRARTRAALGQLVGDVLSSRLDALETRLAKAPWITGRLGPTSAPAGRLREVLDRDRALAAAQPGARALALVEPPLPVTASSATIQDAALPSVPVAPATPAPVFTPEEGAQEVQREPIRTRTMARLLAAQGYRARAEAIFRALLVERPDDAELRAELERLRAHSA